MALGILQDETTGEQYQYDPTSNTNPFGVPVPSPSTPSPSDITTPNTTPWTGGFTGQGQDPTPNTTPTAPAGGGYGPMEGVDATKLNDPSHQSDKYIAARILASGGSLQQAAAAIGATVIDGTRMRLRTGEVIDTRRDQEGANALQWLVEGGGSGGAANASASGSDGGRNPFASAQTGTQFDDPVTKEWEGMLRQLVDRLNTPQPMWTNSQLDLMQTQALDPLERQRQQEKQQAQLRLSSRGITPGSGIFESAMRDIDRQFDEMRTRTQSGFATNAVNREDQLFQSNEARNINAVNMFKQIPQYADTRLQLAMGALTPSNPYQLLALQNQMQQQGYQNSLYQNQQDQQFWMQLAQMLANAFT